MKTLFDIFLLVVAVLLLVGGFVSTDGGSLMITGAIFFLTFVVSMTLEGLENRIKKENQIIREDLKGFFESVLNARKKPPQG